MNNYFNMLFNFFKRKKNSFFSKNKKNYQRTQPLYKQTGYQNGNTKGQKGCFGQSVGQKKHKERIKKYS